MRPRFRDAAKNDAARECVRDWRGLFVGFKSAAPEGAL
jgi:hypothetical protein